MFDLNVLLIECLINKILDLGLGIKFLVYKMVSFMSYVMYQTKSDIKRLVCIFVIFMIVLLSYYALFYSFNCHIHELFWLIGFFVAFFYINNPAFCKTNSSGKTWDTRQKIFYAALLGWCDKGPQMIRSRVPDVQT